VKVTGDAGDDGHRKIYLMNLDGSDLFELFSMGNARAPSFSPDGGWITFTGNLNQAGNPNGCEIYIMKLTDKEPQQLTKNDYCDWQPRWGR
jgi:TolB protein